MATQSGTVATRLREARETAGLTQQQAADWLGIRRPGIAEIESGKRGVKTDELVRLASLYGRSLHWFAIGETVAEDHVAAALFRAGQHENHELRRHAASLSRRCRLVCTAEAKLGIRRNSVLVPQYANERAVQDQTLAQGHGAQIAYQERGRLGMGMRAPLRDPWGIVEASGVHVLALDLGQDHAIDGIFTRSRDGAACVGINVGKWIFRQIFTVVHEYGHALMDSDLQSEICATDCAWKGSSQHLYANRELRANQFAAVFLVPKEALLWYFESRNKLTPDRWGGLRAEGVSPLEVVRAQDHFGVSADMILWRLRNENLITAAQRSDVRSELRRAGTHNIARSLGYNWRDRAQPFTRAHEIALDAYERGHISLGMIAEIFGKDKEDMSDALRGWNISQAFSAEDQLVGALS
jgi:Zn-dependent peptidase ImmA (M78 family)/DNA-binding XRE family transcriptional regulator